MSVDGAALQNPNASEPAKLTHEESIQRFIFPSVTQNIKHFTIMFDEARIQFKVNRHDLKETKTYVNQTFALAGPEVVNAFRTRAIRDLAIGDCCIIGGIGVTIASFRSAANSSDGGQYTVWYGLVLFGIIEVGRGFYYLRQHNEIRKLQAQQS